MPAVQTVPVSVSYDSGSQTFTYNPPAPKVAVLPGNNAGNENYAVVFTLTGADWADPWITWGPGNGAPPPLQPGYTIPPMMGNRKAIGINNSNTGTSAQSFDFTLHVVPQVGGVMHSSDPDIVLDPP